VAFRTAWSNSTIQLSTYIHDDSRKVKASFNEFYRKMIPHKLVVSSAASEPNQIKKKPKTMSDQ
jgi:hypothetical protein